MNVLLNDDGNEIMECGEISGLKNWRTHFHATCLIGQVMNSVLLW